MDAVEQKIRSFAQLEDGWHYREGRSFTSDILDRAISFWRGSLEPAGYRTAAFPALDGRVFFSVTDWDSSGLDLEMEILIGEDGDHGFSVWCGSDDVVFDENLTPDELKQRLDEIVAKNDER